MANVFTNLAKNVPEANDRLTKQRKAAQDILLQKSLGGAQVPAQANVSRVAQDAAPQVVQAQANIDQQGVAANQQALADIGQQGLQQQATDQATQLKQAELAQGERLTAQAAGQELSLTREGISSQKKITEAELATASRLQSYGIEQDNKLLNIDLETRRQLESIGRDIKDKLLDSRLRFEASEAGRKFSNDRQLRDYMVLSAQNEQQFGQKMTQLRQEYQKEAVLAQILRTKITDALERGWLSNEQQLDHETARKLKYMEAELRKKEAKAKAKAGNNMMITQGLGMLVVAGVVAASGGTAAAVMGGAAMGGGAGSIVQGTVQPSY